MCVETSHHHVHLLGVLLRGQDRHLHVGGRGQHPGAVGRDSVEMRNHRAELNLEDRECGWWGVEL